MGLFDIFRKQQPEPPDPPQGRRFEYAFAHWAFPWMVERHPIFFLMLSDDDPQWSSKALASLFEHASLQSGPPTFRPEDLRLIRTTAGGYRCLVIVLPPPREATDAFMIGLVHIHPPDAPVTEPIVLRNFTLEFNEFYQPPHTVFCEWTVSPRSHKNYGAGPSPEPDAFVERMEQMLASDQPRT
jgi:hypothetical protein